LLSSKTTDTDTDQCFCLLAVATSESYRYNDIPSGATPRPTRSRARARSDGSMDFLDAKFRSRCECCTQIIPSVSVPTELPPPVAELLYAQHSMLLVHVLGVLVGRIYYVSTFLVASPLALLVQSPATGGDTSDFN
jgi:hypothetical protein